MKIPSGTYFILQIKSGTHWCVANGGQWMRDENQLRDRATRMRKAGYEVKLTRLTCELSNIPFGGEEEIAQTVDDLTKEYLDRCEEFNRNTCQYETQGVATPKTAREIDLVNQNECLIFEELVDRAIQKLPLTRDTAKTMLRERIRLQH